MDSRHQLVFGPFRLDPVTPRLWRGDQLVELQPRPLAVLHYLAQRPGQIVSKEELLTHVWAGTYVTKTVLKVSIRAIREALADEVTAPQYIETVGREGYRFLGGIVRSQPSVISKPAKENQKAKIEDFSPAPNILKSELLLHAESEMQNDEQKSGPVDDKTVIAPSPDGSFAHSSPEECFLRAIDIARTQQAKSLELRAVMSLVRLRQQQAALLESRITDHATHTNLAKDHRMLCEMYNWFTEGFDTKDLEEAKVLRDALLDALLTRSN